MLVPFLQEKPAASPITRGGFFSEHEFWILSEKWHVRLQLRCITKQPCGRQRLHATPTHIGGWNDGHCFLKLWYVRQRFTVILNEFKDFTVVVFTSYVFCMVVEKEVDSNAQCCYMQRKAHQVSQVSTCIYVILICLYLNSLVWANSNYKICKETHYSSNLTWFQKHHRSFQHFFNDRPVFPHSKCYCIVVTSFCYHLWIAPIICVFSCLTHFYIQ